MPTCKQLVLFPHGDEKEYDVNKDVNNPMAAEDLGNIEIYPEKIKEQIMEVFGMFDFSGREEINPRIIYGIACFSREDIEKLNNVQEKGLKINSFNIFSIVGTPLEDKDIQVLTEWQKHGFEAETREMLLVMLLGYNEGFREEINAIYSWDIEDYINNYLIRNNIRKNSEVNGEVNEQKYLTFDDLHNEFLSINPLVALYSYLKITNGVNLKSEKGVYSLVKKLKNLKLSFESLKFLIDYNIKLSDEGIFKINDKNVGMLKNFFDNNKLSTEIKMILSYYCVKIWVTGKDVDEQKMKMVCDLCKNGNKEEMKVIGDMCKNFMNASLCNITYKALDDVPGDTSFISFILNNFVSDGSEDFLLDFISFVLEHGKVVISLFKINEAIKKNLPAIDFKDNKVKSTFLSCNPDLLTEENINFIFERFKPNSSKDPIKKFLELVGQISKINNIREYLVPVLDKYGLKIDFSSHEMQKKLLYNTNVETLKLLTEENKNYISENLNPSKSRDPIREILKLVEQISKINNIRKYLVPVLDKYGFKIDFSDSKVKNRLFLCKDEMFSEKNINFIFKNLIPKDCKNPFDVYLSYDKNIDKINLITKSGCVSGKLLDLLAGRFDIEGKKLLGFVGDKSNVCYSLDYDELNETIDLLDTYLCSNGKFDFKSLNWNIGNVFDLLQKKNVYEKLFYIEKYLQKDVFKSVSANEGPSFDDKDPYETSFWLFKTEETKCDNYLEEIRNCRNRINDLKRQIDDYLKLIELYKKKIEEIKINAYDRYVRIRNQEVDQLEKEYKDRVSLCNSFFEEGVSESNFSEIFDNFFDIVFDGKDNKFLNKILKILINRFDFLEKMLDISLNKDAPHIVFPILKYLNNSGAFEFVYKIMSKRGYFGSLVYGVSKNARELGSNSHSSELFYFILSKHGELEPADKVKLLPYVSSIKFGGKDDLDNFLRDIVREFGSLCLKPHYSDIARCYRQFGFDLKSEYSYFNDEKDFKDRCKDNLYIQKDINKIYSKGSGWLSGNIISDKSGNVFEQKFLLLGNIIDSQNIDFVLSTNNKAYYHKDLHVYGYGDVFGGGFLSKNDLEKKIIICGYSVDFSRVNPKLYPVISDILGKNFPDFEVVFRTPNYYPK